MRKPEDELEFISVNTDDDQFSMNQQYGGSQTNEAGGMYGGYDAVIGNWLLKQSKHPAAVLFHLLFKTLALLVYIFGGWFWSSFIFTFVLCIILLAFDFWTVKNISGRLLVGLRWWSYVREDGSNEWIFESLEDMAELSALDARIFWGALYASPCCWAFLFIIGLLRLKIEYLPIIVAALCMNGANIIGYYKCSNSAKSKLNQLADQSAMQRNASWLLSFLMANTNPVGGANSAESSHAV